ncbi:MAG: hypothetical protein RLZZ312_1714 [Bacteroidota bacterium]|jgi:hypothetical protein
MTFKQKVHAQYLQLVQDKIDVFRDRISALTEDSKNDAKGSAGDKHETALSMMHIEQEKANYKLQEYLTQFDILKKIDATKISAKVSIGSLAQVNKMFVYVSVALPKIVVDDKTVYAISPQSPLGTNITGHSKEFSFELNGTRFEIITIE